jgi:multimeric flavodoxin WrbA
MIDIISKLLNADAVVLVSPLYYFGMTAQLKTVIDRFYSVNSLLKESHKKLYLIAAATNTYNWTMDGIETHYKTLCKYLNWEEGGSLLCYGLSTRHAAENSEYKEKAREFGRKLK